MQGPENFGGAVAPHVFASLGGRGGFDDDDRRALDELAANHGLAEEAPSDSAPVISFTCDMLQRQELTGDAGNGRLRRRWVTMSCDDEDDYDAMVKLACDVESLHENTSLLFLNADEVDGGPFSQNWFARVGRVEKAKMARQQRSVRVLKSRCWPAALGEVVLQRVSG